MSQNLFQNINLFLLYCRCLFLAESVDVSDKLVVSVYRLFLQIGKCTPEIVHFTPLFSFMVSRGAERKAKREVKTVPAFTDPFQRLVR